MGKRRCFIDNCPSNNKDSKVQVSLHAFPSPKDDKVTFLKWISFCQLTETLAETYVNDNSRLCSFHFSPICYFPNTKRLIKGSHPSCLAQSTPSGSFFQNGDIFSESEIACSLILSSSHPKAPSLTFDDIVKHSFQNVD